MRHLQSAFLVLLIACAGCFWRTAFAQVVFSVDSELSQIQQLIQKGHNAEALARVRRALEHSPNEPNLHNFLGVIEAQNSNYLAAEASFRRAIECAPKLTSAYFNLGRFYQENPGKDPQALTKAVDNYKALLTHHPGNAEARYQCARFVCLQGNFQEALTHLSRLPAADQKLSHVLIISLTANSGLGRRTAVEQAASRLLLNSNLTEADVLPFLPALTKHGQVSTAVSLLQQLDQGSNLSSEGLQELALLYERTGRLPEARKALERAAGSNKPSSGQARRLGEGGP